MLHSHANLTNLDADSDDDDDFVLDLSERMQDVNLNDADEIWDRLTEEEKTRFNTVLKSGEIAKLIPDYEPWWNQRSVIAVTRTRFFFKKT